jgi:teichuronic acid biosynthesis glycosyltransferase TuaG
MHQPLISIIIPTFNQADFLKDALQSVRAQSCVDWEAIVINNFSSDHTIDIVEQLNDDRVTLVNFSNHGVIARSRNLGIRSARGDYVAFLDSDDLWEVDKLARCISKLEEGFDLVCHAERWFGGGLPDRVVRYGPESRATYESLLTRGNCISTSATVVRKGVLDSLQGFRDKDDFVTTEDYDLWLRVAQSNYKIGFVDEVLGSFRRHSSSASSSTNRHLKAELAVLEEHFAVASTNLKKRQRSRTAFAYYSAARSFSKGRQTKNAFRAFGKSLMLNPTSPRTWAGLLVHSLQIPLSFSTTSGSNDK